MLMSDLLRAMLCRYSKNGVRDYDATFAAVKKAMMGAFFGPAHVGVFSPSVQYTAMEMAKAVIIT